ncbi:glycosyltransferase [uncultured Bacteroides sp.]|uniref:glycosyltransferase n=1 Tax=uncultured Bacteroides sp. TaxID=162156 RepID=UPI0026199ECD|nr:glycosyltransferase [uncultured Bacteroides sp.]
MERILFVAPSSYPINGPEAMVNAKHIALLCNAGYSVDLVCRGIRKQNNIYPSRDSDIHFEKLNSIHVVSVDTNWNIKTIWRHLRTLLKTGYVYRAADWSVKAIQVCENLLKKRRYDYIFTKDYPSEIVGIYFAKKGIKWIPTWNDPYMWQKYPAPYGHGVNYREGIFRRRLIADIGRYATINIFPSERLKNYMLLYMKNMKEQKCVIMPHIMLNKESSILLKKEKNVDRLKIIHAGSIGRERNPQKCLSAIKKFVENNPDRKIELMFLGVIQRATDNFLDLLIKQYDLEHIVKFHPPVSYQESLKIVAKYDICLLIEAPCKEGIFLPSKVVDYLQNKKPIFAISPQNGMMSDLHKQGIVDYVANVIDVEDIYKTLEQAYNDYISGNLLKNKALDKFEESTIVKLHQTEILR